MGLPAKTEPRRSSRRVMLRILPGAIIDASNAVVQCRPVDLSTEGLSILSESNLDVGDQLTLRTHNASIELEVVWRRADFGKQGLSRYGLKTKDSTVDLEILFRETGCLKLI
ncbi:MAG: PilZ domain-containing protein [Chitinophagaceae bacterium]|nr:PilZ domain-containing protein [Oligoflexus sp.]